ncbi:hypothetical protein DEU56DRAFT_910380 [Suillus clintonianus]|uniref:uncharacterized protein n=1 Tax=Suillus clintonianus TaxID=1904413 RepID=UPI001B874DC6|nr:uncharacterized protein DEU56DRAFT_910380 [Suillus clintonianus]KAG2145260.1 hypothetical protein DEU56DRAFT_910380 [Suillus clintonianus]
MGYGSGAQCAVYDITPPSPHSPVLSVFSDSSDSNSSDNHNYLTHYYNCAQDTITTLWDEVKKTCVLHRPDEPLPRAPQLHLLVHFVRDLETPAPSVWVRLGPSGSIRVHESSVAFYHRRDINTIDNTCTMSSFQLLIQQLELSSDAITTASISSLFLFITIGTTLKNDIILAEPSSTPINEPPDVLPPAIAKFLGAGCSISLLK